MGWYPGALCIKDREKAALRGNWFVQQYSMPFIAITECKNSTANGNRCKSPEEIKRYLEGKDFFFIHQHTYVESDMFRESDKVNEFPYFGDRDNYFPTSRQ